MGNRNYISMDDNRFEVDGVRGTLRVVRYKSKNLSLFTIGVYSKEISCLLYTSPSPRDS